MAEQIDVGGITTFLAEAPGQIHAGLLFGVGVADEPLPMRGITHLCEHLVLGDVDYGDLSWNGYVGANTTGFVASGTPGDIATYFNGVISRLGDIPAKRLKIERSILRAESETRALGALSMLYVHRFGATSFGRVAYDEYGLSHLRAEQLSAWAAEHFVARRAALWIAGPDPHTVVAQLGGQLPAGTGARPRLIEDRLPTPRRVIADVAGPNLSLLTARTTAFAAAVTLMRDRLEADLRHERGLAYTVGMSYERLDARTAHSHIGVDALTDGRVVATQAMYAAVDAFAVSPAPDEAVDRYRRQFEANRANPLHPVHVAQRRALLQLMGATESEVTYAGELAELTGESVRAAWADALGSGLFLIPDGVRPHSRFPLVAPPSSAPLRGAAFKPIAGFDRRERLVVASDGVSASVGGTGTTIPLVECEALLAWNDGHRALIRADGEVIHVRPWKWRRGDRAVDAVDTLIPSDKRIDMGEGDGPPAEWRGVRGAIGRLVRGHTWVVAVATCLVVAGLFALMPWAEHDDERRERESERLVASANALVAQRLADEAEGQLTDPTMRSGSRPANLLAAVCVPPTEITPGSTFECSARGVDGGRHDYIATILEGDPRRVLLTEEETSDPGG